MSGRSLFGLIPAPARILAALMFLTSTVFFSWIFDDHHAIGVGTAIGMGIGAFGGAFVLLAGYVYADASRRGMPPIPWTALAVMIPNCVGFVLYFLLRKPILLACSSCGCGVAPDAAFCSRCGASQARL